MQITWRKVQGGYEVRLFLEYTQCLIVQQERWLVSLFNYGIRGSGSVLVPIQGD